MFSFDPGAWRWHFYDAEDARELGPAPEELMLRAREIRNTGGKRIVYAGNGYFFKHERPQPKWTRYWQERISPRAREELRSLCKLSRLGFPTVRPAAWGARGTESILITRAAVGTITLREYLDRHTDRGEIPSEEFLDQWMDILARLVGYRIYIPDFHCGNLLYDEANRAFFIVDPPGMTRMLLPRPDRVLRMLKRQFAPILEYFPDDTFVSMLSRVVKKPEKFFRWILKYNSLYVRYSQLRRGKRLRDFRRGRFSAKQGDLELRYRAEGRPFSLDSTEELRVAPETAAALWERDFVLGLHYLPRLRIVGRNAANNTLYRERAGDAPVDDAARKSLRKRLKIAGYPPEEFDLATDVHGRTVLVDRAQRIGS